MGHEISPPSTVFIKWFALIVCTTRWVTTSSSRIVVRRSSSSLIVHALNAQYKFFARSLVWDEAETECRQLWNGGHLATVNSQKENDYLYRQLVTRKIESAWIGLTDKQREGDFRWSDGKITKPVYTNWRKRQPNGGLGQNCVEMIPGSRYNKWAPAWNGTWNDIGCEAARAFICKRDLDIVKPAFAHPELIDRQKHLIALPGESARFSCIATSAESVQTYHWFKKTLNSSTGEMRLETMLSNFNQSELFLKNIRQEDDGFYSCVVKNEYGNRTVNYRLRIFQTDYRFNFVASRTSWFDANNKCQEWNGNLVTITSTEKNMYLRNVLKRRSIKSAWVDLQSQDKINALQWLNSSSISNYTNARKQHSSSNVHDTKIKRTCVELIAENIEWKSDLNTSWNKIDCEIQRSYICEKMKDRYHHHIILNNTMNDKIVQPATNITSYCRISTNQRLKNLHTDWLISNRTINETWLKSVMRKETKIESLRRKIMAGLVDYFPSELHNRSADGSVIHLSENYTKLASNDSIRYITCIVFNQYAFDFATMKVIVKEPQVVSNLLHQSESERAYWPYVVGWIGLAALVSLFIFLTTYINIVQSSPPDHNNTRGCEARIPFTLHLSFEEI